MAGEILKSQNGWSNNGNGTDEYGFSALPAGHYDSGIGFGAGGYHDRWQETNKDCFANFWSSNNDVSADDELYQASYGIDDYNGSIFAYFIELSCQSKGTGPFYHYKGDGFSVRCIKDEDE